MFSIQMPFQLQQSIGQSHFQQHHRHNPSPDITMNQKLWMDRYIDIYIIQIWLWTLLEIWENNDNKMNKWETARIWNSINTNVLSLLYAFYANLARLVIIIATTTKSIKSLTHLPPADPLDTNWATSLYDATSWKSPP